MANPTNAPLPARCSDSLRAALTSAGLAFALLHGQPAQAEPPSLADSGKDSQEKNSGSRPTAEQICRTLAAAAAENGIPLDLFTRLIWQESRFNPNAVSPKGAQGIAQFMPGTASGRGLADPFDPLTALRESAAYLRELRTTFKGNLGLAAAAYNAGPGRVEGWLAGLRSLPPETRAYVLAITGHSVEIWNSQEPPEWQVSTGTETVDCTRLSKLITASLHAPRPALRTSPAWGPWGVQLTANWSEGRALATYERLRRSYGAVLADRLPLVLRARRPGRRGATKFIIRVSEQSRQRADTLCDRLRAAGAACAVLRNPSR
ncbi:MAG TPA: lytic transglycosylase domain-containing protein [Hyphomicrobiaceae bacterium]|nr:lytic transglycosylase domain-containing protein [Hyphomicrobiaceae bacterium]